MSETAKREVLEANQRLLESILAGDWKTYVELCDPSLTAFEPEAAGHLVEGLSFHEYYFRLEGSKSPKQATMATPHVRLVGDVAVLCYVRLTQSLNAEGAPVTSSVEETRVWQRKDGRWVHVHFHRSPC